MTFVPPFSLAAAGWPSEGANTLPEIMNQQRTKLRSGLMKHISMAFIGTKLLAREFAMNFHGTVPLPSVRLWDGVFCI